MATFDDYQGFVDAFVKEQTVTHTDFRGGYDQAFVPVSDDQFVAILQGESTAAYYIPALDPAQVKQSADSALAKFKQFEISWWMVPLQTGIAAVQAWWDAGQFKLPKAQVVVPPPYIYPFPDGVTFLASAASVVGKNDGDVIDYDGMKLQLFHDPVFGAPFAKWRKV